MGRGHSPEWLEQVDGQERPVQTDVWRIFSGAKDCAHYNALLIEEIFVHYSGQELHKESKLRPQLKHYETTLELAPETPLAMFPTDLARLSPNLLTFLALAS